MEKFDHERIYPQREAKPTLYEPLCPNAERIHLILPLFTQLRKQFLIHLPATTLSLASLLAILRPIDLPAPHAGQLAVSDSHVSVEKKQQVSVESGVYSIM